MPSKILYGTRNSILDVIVNVCECRLVCARLCVCPIVYSFNAINVHLSFFSVESVCCVLIGVIKLDVNLDTVSSTEASAIHPRIKSLWDSVPSLPSFDILTIVMSVHSVEVVGDAKCHDSEWTISVWLIMAACAHNAARLTALCDP